MPSITIHTIQGMVARSQAVALDASIGHRLWCDVEKRFDEGELVDIERRWSFSIPVFYREFLSTIGSGVFFSDPSNYHIGLELRRLDDLLEMVATLSSKPDCMVFSRCIPIGRYRDSGQTLALKTDIGAGDELLLLSSLPDSWDELDIMGSPSYSFEGWLQVLLEKLS